MNFQRKVILMSEILEAVGLKTCSKCKQTLPVSEFGKCKSYKDGLQYQCKSCKNTHLNGWRDKNYDHMLEVSRKWNDENREHLNELQRQRRDKNRDQVNEYSREWIANKRATDPIYQQKEHVRRITNLAIARGDLIRPDECAACGSVDNPIEAHHSSYEPGDELNVTWLCMPCHRKLHRINKD